MSSTSWVRLSESVIEGRVIHEKGCMECGGRKNGYGPEVRDIYMQRIAYSMDLHNQSVRVRSSHLPISNETKQLLNFQAMRYPLDAHRKELVAAQGARESLQRKSRKGT